MECQHPATVKSNDRTRADRKRRRWRTFLSRRVLLFIFYSISLVEIINLPFHIDAKTPKYETAYACEGKTLTIECGKGSYINLIRANYGRFSITICNDHGNDKWSVNCMSYKSLRVLQSKCEQQQNCSVMASTSLFGDPCAGTHKYLEAHYQCVDASQLTTTSTQRPVVPPWLITSQPSVFITSTSRPTRFTVPPSSTSLSPGGGSTAASSVLLPNVTPTLTNDTAHVPALAEGPVVPTTATSTSDLAMEPKTSLLFNNAKPIRGNNKDGPGNGEEGSRAGSNGASSANVGDQLFCGPTQARNLFWNLTRFNDLNVQPCPPGAVGLAKWRCQLQFPHLRMMLKHIDYSQDAQQMRLWSIWQSFWTDFDGGISEAADAAVKLVETELDKRHWYPQAQPDLTGCHSLWLTSIEQRLKQPDSSLINLVNDLAQVTNNKKLYGGDLLLTMKIIKLIYTKISHSQDQIEDPKQREQVVYELLNGTLKIFSNLIDKRNFQMWQDLSATDRKYLLTELLVHLEENSFLLAELIQRERHIVQKVQNILLSVRILNVRDMNQLQVFPDEKLDEQQWQLNEDRIEIPRPALLENSDNGLVRVVFVAFDRLERILRPAQSFIFQLKTLAINRQPGAAEATEGDRFFQYARNHSKGSGGSSLDASYDDKLQLLGGGSSGLSSSSPSGASSSAGDDDEAKWHHVYDEMRRNIEQKTADNVIILNSKIISASLGRSRHVELSHPVRIHFKHIQVDNVTNPICVFWNFIDHAWSEDGCRVELTNATHTTCACDHLTNFALLMVQKQTPEAKFFHAMNENNHLQTAAVTDEAGPETVSPVDQMHELESLSDFKKILLRNFERILSKNWDFLSQREVRELTGREQEQIFEAWKQQGLIDDASNVEKRRAIELIRSEFLRLKNFSRIRKMLVLIKNSLFWKMRRFNGTPLRVTRQINWRELPKTPLVRDFLRSLIKFRDFLRDGKMDNEKVQSLDLVLTERQENAFIVRFMLLNEAYMRQFMNMSMPSGVASPESLSRVRSFRALNSFYIQEQMQFLQRMRQQKKEEKVFGAFPDSQLMDEFRKVEKDEWFGIDDIRADEITDHGLFGGGAGNGVDGDNDRDRGDDGNGLEHGYGSEDDNLFLYQLVRNNTTLRLFIYLSVVLCVVLIVVAIVLLKLYHGSMFKVANRSFIAKNVYVCLVVFQLLLLVGLEHDRRDIFCGINALLFHIVGLAIAAWLCFEGYQLHAVISRTEDFLHPHYMVPPTALDMNFTPSHLKRHGASQFPVRMIYSCVTYGSIVAIALVVCVFGGYNLVYVQESDNCLCMSRMVWRVPPIPQFVNGDEAFGGNQSWIPLEPRILSSTGTENQDMSAFTEKMPMANYYFYFTFLLPVAVLFLATLFFITRSIFKIYKKYCQYQAFGQEEHDAQMLQAVNGGGGINTKTLDGKLRPNVYHMEKERMLMNGIRFYLRGSVIFLLIFSITWIFGYAFINRSPNTVLYGYLFAFFNLLEGIFILLFVCVQHDKVQEEFEKWRRRKSLLNNPYSGQSPDDNGSPGAADVPVRRRPLLDSLCCCLNVLFHPQQEQHVPFFDNGRHQVEIRAREDMLTYGMGGGVGRVAGTMGRTGVSNGIPMADPRLCTPSHARPQYYMDSLERNANPQFYHDDGVEDERQQQHMMNYMNDLDAAMTRPIAFPQYDGEEEVAATGHGYYPQPHLMAMMMNGEAEDPYNHMQNFEHVMHRKESHDRRVEDELWQGAAVPSQEQLFLSQSQLAGPEFRRGGEAGQSSSGTHGRTRRKKGSNGGGGHYQVGGSAAGSSYNVHGDSMMNGDFPMEGRHRGDEPIYEEIVNNVAGGSGRQNPGSRHLSAFLNEKGNSVISCLEPIK